MNVTVPNINKVAKKFGIKLVKGRGYYYWVGTNDKTDLTMAGLDTTSVYTYRASDLSWEQWMSELDYILKKSKLGKLNETMYMRTDMPQIKRDKLDKAFRIIKNHGIGIKKGLMLADKMKPSQKDIYMQKVNQIKQAMNGRNASLRDIKPFILSKDGYLVDGHHRWMAVRQAFPNAKVPVIIIMLPIQKAVELYSKVAEIV